ncbi:uncharacterized protein LOC9637930 [Selaginella moellendorffii]|uniref:uncharacterized protein LOC9637930 n=1 Tax=Selaginella moellendorffii TaxID=88036 RepID=UPI000D1C4503|nr:uncharacterized protein LOC9637930 [Selaginella moellendorffii]|eukprot:XP_024533964.1 uncharacterized protein LOC9637930 [Selaginella moellendorffii]
MAATGARLLGGRMLCSILAEPRGASTRCLRFPLPRNPSSCSQGMPPLLVSRRFASMCMATDRNAWEERNLNDWAISKLRELLLAAEPITFGEGSAYVTDVSRCTGDAAILTVRGKRRVDYSFDILLDFLGKIEVGEPFQVEGTLSVDTCLGDLDDLRIDVAFTEVPETLPEPEREHLRSQMSQFLPKIRTQLECFEKEIKELVCD